MSNSRKSLFIVISAPSGTGKTTVDRKVLSQLTDCLRSISVTTRKPRSGEREEVDYRFVTPARFQKMIDQGDFFEWEEVHGFLYGTPKVNLGEATRKGVDLLLDIDVRGALSIKKGYPESVLIFLSPPSLEVLEARLRGRRTEGEESLQQRLKAARREMEAKKEFDYVIINDELDQAVREVIEIIRQEREKRKT